MTAPLREDARTERREALRRLLARPLLLADRDPEAYAWVVRHRAELVRWFDDNAGWRLLVDPAGRHARLLKRPARPDATRPARTTTGARRPFDRRRYALLSLALAALDGEQLQVTLARLAEAVRELSLEEPSLAPFDPEQAHERHAFVDVVRFLCELGVLAQRDGDDERYARSREGDALYDVGERILSHLVAAPRPPALSASPAVMMEEERGETEEGERTRARHAVFRRLLDDPVVYHDELDDRARDWLLHGSGHLYERLRADAGLSVERREEGLAAIDPAGELTDTPFPEGSSTVKHAALLLCEWLADRARRAREARDAAPPPHPYPSPPGSAPGRGIEGEGDASAAVPWADVVARVADLREAHAGRWAKEFEAGAEGAEELAREALGVLVAFGLAAPARPGDGDGSEAAFAARPAAARFAPAEPAMAREDRR